MSQSDSDLSSIKYPADEDLPRKWFRRNRDFLVPVCSHWLPFWLCIWLGTAAFLSGPCSLLGYDRPSYLTGTWSGELVSAVHFQMDGVLHSVNLTKSANRDDVRSHIATACKGRPRCTNTVSSMLEERFEMAEAAEEHRWRSCFTPSAVLWNLGWFVNGRGRYRWFLRAE